MKDNLKNLLKKGDFLGRLRNLDWNTNAEK